jgi:hypothetical protein
MTMIPIEFLEDYLIDQEDGLKKLLTWFLNLVMQLEAMEQEDAAGGKDRPELQRGVVWQKGLGRLWR